MAHLDLTNVTFYATMRDMKIGATKLDRFTAEDYETIKTARLDALNVMARLPFPSGYFILGQVAPLLDKYKTYVQSCVAEIAPAYESGCRNFEVHYWPNSTRGGLGWSHAGGTDFAQWWVQVVRDLRHEFPNALFGFPKLEEGDTVGSYRYNSDIFRREAFNAIEEADFVSMAVAWKGRKGNLEDMMAAQWNVRSNILLYKKPVYATASITNNNIGKPVQTQQFVAFVTEMSITPMVEGVFYHTLSSAYQEDIWCVMRSDSKESAMANIIGQRTP